MAYASSESPPRPRHSNSSLDTEFVPLCVCWPHWTVTEVLKEVRAAPGGGGAGSYMVVQTVKNQPAMQETKVWSLGQEDPLEKEMATHSSVLAWRIPWTEELGCLQSMGLHRVRHDWLTKKTTHTHTGDAPRKNKEVTGMVRFWIMDITVPLFFLSVTGESWGNNWTQNTISWRIAVGFLWVSINSFN